MEKSLSISRLSLEELTVLKLSRTAKDIAGYDKNGAPMPIFGYVLSGSGVFVKDSLRIPLAPGDAVFIPKGQCYTSYWEPVSFYSLQFSFTDEALNQSLFNFEKVSLPELRPDFDALYEAHIRGDSLRALAQFYRVLGALSARFAPRTAADHRAILPALTYIDAHYAEPIRTVELARLCCISESGFYAKFHAAVGKTPITYCNTVRIRKAQNLLIGTDLTVEQISEQVGFCSPAYFRRVFREITGQLPGAVRRRETL